MSGSHGIIYRIDKLRWVTVVGDGFAAQDDPGACRSSSGCPMVTVSMSGTHEPDPAVAVLVVGRCRVPAPWWRSTEIAIGSAGSASRSA